MKRNHKLFSFLAIGFVLISSTLGLLNISPPKVEAARFEPGCYLSTGGQWVKKDCSVFAIGPYESFKADSSKCYAAWEVPWGFSAPVQVRCYAPADYVGPDSPEPTSAPQYPVGGTPGNLPIVTLDPGQPNCFNSGGDQSYTPVTCSDEFRTLAGLDGITLESGKCYVASASLPPKITRVECATIQNAVQLDHDVKAQIDIPKAETYYCGGPAEDQKVYTSINIGCRGRGNAIIDMVLSFTRFLSAGAGIVCVASMIVGAIQFTASGGNPKATSDAVKRMASSAGALVFFLFIYAILNWIVPGGLL